LAAAMFTSEVSAVFERNDKDGDEKLSRQEFKDMMMKRRGSQ
jgi:Ca2+-binding EF-hand superfamily protein